MPKPIPFEAIVGMLSIIFLYIFPISFFFNSIPNMCYDVADGHISLWGIKKINK